MAEPQRSRRETPETHRNDSLPKPSTNGKVSDTGLPGSTTLVMFRLLSLLIKPPTCVCDAQDGRHDS